MRRPGQWEATRLDIVGLSESELSDIRSLLGPPRSGRRTRWHWWSSAHSRLNGGMIRHTVFDADAAEALWLRYGSDPRLVDCLRNHDGSASVKFVESYTHWIDGPFSDIAPAIHWARQVLHRHHFEWGGGVDRWLLWLKTDEARAEFLRRWNDLPIREAPTPEWDRDDGRLLYIRRIQAEARAGA